MTPCVHHWKIDAPSGIPFVKGVCQKCHMERNDFATSVEAMEEDVTPKERYSRDIRAVKRRASRRNNKREIYLGSDPESQIYWQESRWYQ